MLGKEEFGKLGIVQSTVGMFQVFAGFGLGLTATKYVAEFRDSDPAKTGRIIGLSACRANFGRPFAVKCVDAAVGCFERRTNRRLSWI